VLGLPKLDVRLRRFLVETYQQRVLSETGMAPAVRWEADGFLPRLPDSAEQLDLLLLTVAKTRRVHPDGIHFQGYRYLDTTLAAYVGEDAIIRYDPRDLAELRVYFGDEFLCRAINPELPVRPSPSKTSSALVISASVNCAPPWPSGRQPSKHSLGCGAEPTHSQVSQRSRLDRVPRQLIGRA
jgi:Mu transposase, C-terminal